MARNPLQLLNEHGQSVWLDNLSRNLIQDGTLATLIREDGISGITSNPSIFKNAMTSGSAYDGQIRDLLKEALSPMEVYEALAIKDIRDATDILMPVYDRTRGTDGFVSLEVSPHLARDTEGTTQEAVRLWEAVDRPNVLIKIPGTDEGIPAIEACLTRGININITLLFSLDSYRKVIEAYFCALEARREKGEALEKLASVGSFFLSRIDTKVDKLLDSARQDGAPQSTASLRGQSAIANAKLAYQLWKERHATERWKKLAGAGARLQRPLWASTSTKDPREPDTKYVAALIGLHTVNTMPDETVNAFRDHGMVESTLEEGVEEARKMMEELRGAGVDMKQVTDELVEEGIQKFVQPFDDLLKALEAKCRALA